MKDIKQVSNTKNVIDYITAYPTTSNDKFGNHKVNEKFFRALSSNTIDDSMMDFSVSDSTMVPVTEMFCFERRFDKEYYREKFPHFDEYVYNILEWSSADKLDELKLRYNNLKRERKLKERRELKKKMKELEIKYNSKKARMKKIKKNIILEF